MFRHTHSRQTAYSALKPLCTLFLLGALSAPAWADYTSKTITKANTLVQKGKVDEARKLLNKLIIKRPKSAEAYNNLAAIEAELGNKQAAKALLEQALSTSQGHKLAYENILKLNRSIALDSYKESLNLTNQNSQVTLKPAQTAFTLSQAAPQIIEKPVEKIVYVDKPVEKVVEKIVYVDKPVEKVVEKIVYIDKPTEKIIDNQTASTGNTPTLEDAKTLTLNWASAWQSRDIPTYINSYVNDFSNVNSGRHDHWISHRTSRIQTPKFIHIKLENIQVKRLSPNTATVTFLQHYKSDLLSDTITKQLLVTVEDGHWKIQKESIVN